MEFARSGGKQSTATERREARQIAASCKDKGFSRVIL